MSALWNRTGGRLRGLALALLASSTALAGERTGSQIPTAGGVGLLPVYDASGEAYGESFAQYLTSSLFSALSRQRGGLVLLNPGGLYSPLDEAATLEHAGAAGVTSVVIAMLKPARRDRPRDSAPDIDVEMRVVNATTGVSSRTVSLREQVKRRDLERGFDTGSGAYQQELRGSTEGRGPDSYWSFARSSRRLSKQPLGKIVLKMADYLSGVVIRELQDGPGLAAAAFPDEGPCAITFGVRYTRQRAASKTYTVIVNGREESASIKDGVLKLSAPSGPLVFEVTVKDPPFRLPVQAVYFANTTLDCGRQARQLTLEIGGAGEGLLVWR